MKDIDKLSYNDLLDLMLFNHKSLYMTDSKESFISYSDNICLIQNELLKRDNECFNKKFKIDNNKDKLDKSTLIDFFISSVDEEQNPIWTDEHIEELLYNFDVIPKENDNESKR